MCGIGWAIEFLKREGFIEGDTDEILEEVDRQVMERDVRRITDASLETGLAGIAAYVRSRLDSKHTTSDYQPFDEEYLNDLNIACQKNDIDWMSETYSVTTLWQTIPSMLPSTNATAWQKGILIINEKHG